MNYLDLIIALPLIWGIYRGFTKGLIISAASLLALVLGIYVTIHFSTYFSGYFNIWFHPDPKHLKLLSFALTFIFVVIIVRLIGWLLDKFIKAVALGIVNRILGVLFNLLKWIFILSVLISIIESGEKSKYVLNEQVKNESVLYKPVSSLAPLVFPYLNFDRFKVKEEGSFPGSSVI